jgi:hypothetical protein
MAPRQKYVRPGQFHEIAWKVQGARCFFCGARDDEAQLLLVVPVKIEGRRRLVCSRGCGKSFRPRPGPALSTAQLEASLVALHETHPDLVGIAVMPRRRRGRRARMPLASYVRRRARALARRDPPPSSNPALAAVLGMKLRTLERYEARRRKLEATLPPATPGPATRP